MVYVTLGCDATVQFAVHAKLPNADVYSNAVHVLPQKKCVTVGCGGTGLEVLHKPHVNSYVTQCVVFVKP